MKLATVLTLGFLIVAPQAFADVTDTALAPGKPAGVHTAQFLDGDNGIFLVAGAALVGITIALATAGNGVSASATSPNGGGGSTTTSTSTGTSP
jgi:hypothetical protein